MSVSGHAAIWPGHVHISHKDGDQSTLIMNLGPVSKAAHLC